MNKEKVITRLQRMQLESVFYLFVIEVKNYKDGDCIVKVTLAPNTLISPTTFTLLEDGDEREEEEFFADIESYIERNIQHI